MRLISSSVTRIVIPCLLVNIRGCLHIGNQHLLHPVEDEVPLHPTNLVITWRDIQLGKDRVFKENFCLIHKTHHKARGGGVDGDGSVHYLFDFSDLVVWLSYRQLILCFVMDNIYDDVVSSLERPDLGQDHEGSLHEPDKLHLDLQRGVNYVWPFGLEVIWEKVG